MQQTEIELCEMADQVVTIGPKLTDAYENQLGKGKVFNLIPSILAEFSDVQLASNERRTFCVLVTESGDSEDFDVKGYDIAVKAIANLNDKSYQLKFASKQRGKEDELVDKLLQCGIGRNQLIICSFDGNKETLANLFSTVDIAILPSKAEGFGLSALVAISAGLPVLVSGNSGIAEALKEVPNGSHCIVDSEDPADWARAIKAVRNKKRSVRLAEAKILHGSYLQKFNWEEPCDFLVKKMCNLAFGGEMKINIDVDDLKLEEQNMQTGKLTTESFRCREGQQPRASATTAASGSVSYQQTEDLRALKAKTFLSIIKDSFYNTNPQSIEECIQFMEYAKGMKYIITDVYEGSLVITVKCESLMILEELWTDYSSGRLGEVVQNCFVTEKILKELNLAELRLKTTMDVEEYNACKMFFEKGALRDALSSEFHSTSLTRESLQIQEKLKKWKQKTKIVETEKLKGILPLPGSSTSDPKEELEELQMKLQRMEGILPLPGSSTSDPKEELEELQMKLQRMECSSSPPLLSTTNLEEKLAKVCENLKKLRLKGRFRFFQFSTVDLEEKLDELYLKFQRLRMEGTLPPPEVFTADLEDELKGLCTELNIVRMKGSSHPLVSTIEVELGELLEQLQKWRKEGSFPVLKFSTIYLEETLAELSDQLQRLRMEGTFLSPALLTADLEEKLKKLLTELERQRDKVSLPPTFSTIEVVDELLKKFPKWRIEDALSSEFHSTSSTSESPQKKEQWEKSEQKTKIMETVKLEGTSPLTVVPTTGHGKELEKRWGRKGMLPLPGSSIFDLEEELRELCKKLEMKEGSLHSLPTTDLKDKLDQVFEEIRMLRMKGSFSVLKLSTTDLEKKLVELSMELHGLRMEGTLPPPELFSTDLEDELKRLEERIRILIRRKREKGSSHSLFFITAKVSRLLHELKKFKMAALENAMYPTIRSGLAKFDVSLPGELQNYVSYLLNESAKLHFRKQEFLSPRALEELRVAMDKDELETFLTIHIREGAWQVVLLFTDELSIFKRPWYCYCLIDNEDEDKAVFNEVIYNSTSGVLNAWPTEYDPDLITLCNAITNRDWKVTKLILNLSRISDEGLKNLSTALTQSELYSLTLYGNGSQIQGFEHLCNALTSVNCRLTNLFVSNIELGDVGITRLCKALTNVNCTLTFLNVRSSRLRNVGIMQLCHALTSFNCRLTSLNVSFNKFGDNGGMYLCNALTSVNCRLTILNVSYNELGDNGLKHLCDALTSSNCALTTLKVGFNRLGDGGIKKLSEVLTNGFCTLTCLDISGNEFGDEGVKYLCKALTDTKCKLRSLDSYGNLNVTDDGKKYLSQMLIGTDWEDKGALRFSRSTTKWTKEQVSGTQP